MNEIHTDKCECLNMTKKSHQGTLIVGFDQKTDEYDQKSKN